MRRTTSADHLLHAQVASLPDAELEPWLAGFVRQRGGPATLLVALDLAAERKALRVVASRVLLGDMADWPSLAPEDTAARALALAEGLRQLPEEAQRGGAGEIAWRLRAWGSSDACPKELRGRLVLALRNFPQHPPEVPREAENEKAVQPVASIPSTLSSPANVAPPPAPERSTPMMRLAQPSAPPQNTAPPVVGKAPSPRLLLPALEATGITADDELDWNLAPRPQAAVEPATPGEPAPPEPKTAPETLEKLTTRELVSRLHGGNSGEAETELRKRGFTDDQLELARHLSAPDVNERRTWTEALPRISQIDTRAWLAWMVDDTDASVRRTALTLLATTLDDETVSLLRKIAGHDPDASIRRMASDLVNRQ
jgi:hypothetical protein